MADALTALDFDAFHAQIAAQIAAAFPLFKTVEFYRDDETEAIPTPAVLLEVSELEPDPTHDAGAGLLPVFVRVEARIIMGIRTPSVKLAVRRAALALAGWLHLRKWGNGVLAGECEVIACAPDEFDPRLDKWAVWRVEWRQQTFVGTDAWAGDPESIPADQFSFVPDVGFGHEADYRPIAEPITP